MQREESELIKHTKNNMDKLKEEMAEVERSSESKCKELAIVINDNTHLKKQLLQKEDESSRLEYQLREELSMREDRVNVLNIEVQKANKALADFKGDTFSMKKKLQEEAQMHIKTIEDQLVNNIKVLVESNESLLHTKQGLTEVKQERA